MTAVCCALLAFLATALVAPRVAAAGRAAPTAHVDAASTAHVDAASLAAGYAFLDSATDASLTSHRLPSSYRGGYLGRVGFTDSYSYDDALVILAYLARRTPDDLLRAAAVGRTLRLAQLADPAGDGRVRASYLPVALDADGDPNDGDDTTMVGDQAWTGIAMARLYQVTGEKEFLDSALALGGWIRRYAADPHGRPGFTGGYDENGVRQTWKSTEHNVDVYAFFGQLARITGDARWTTGAQEARQFVVSMWSPKTSLFTVGTLDDGRTPNTSLVAEDVQSWAYLALLDPRYAGALDAAGRALSARDGRLSGVSFAAVDRSKVWLEGTAHLAAAYQARRDAPDAQRYLDDVRLAQATAATGDGRGVVAASSDGLRTGDDGRYYASLHTGATAWYLLAAQAANPLRL